MEFGQFRDKLKARVRAASSAPRWPAADIERYMAAFQPRRQQFEEAARLLLASIIKPRLEALTELWPSARTIPGDEANRCTCWFASTDRFPVTAKLEFVVEHDESVEHLYVRSEVELMPAFFQFQPHDRLTMPLEHVDQQRVTEWVETRILEFVDSYLAYDRGAEDLDEDVVTDPVCGMRLSRSEAKERSEYRGHPYFFCSTDCRRQFEADPPRFVKFRTL